LYLGWSKERTSRCVIDIPTDSNTETVKSTYKNGILEIVFKKKEQTKPKGKEVEVKLYFISETKEVEMQNENILYFHDSITDKHNENAFK